MLIGGPFVVSQRIGLDSNEKISKKALYSSKINGNIKAGSIFSKRSFSVGHLFNCCSSSRRLVSVKALLSSAVASESDESESESENWVAVYDGEEMEFNRVNCLVWVLHESARSFSLAVESLKLTGSHAGLAMAWNGKDVHGWHKRIAHRV